MPKDGIGLVILLVDEGDPRRSSESKGQDERVADHRVSRVIRVDAVVCNKGVW
jgi:hypothetical protein